MRANNNYNTKEYQESLLEATKKFCLEDIWPYPANLNTGTSRGLAAYER